MIKSSAVLTALVVSATASEYYQWNGKSTDFNEPALWSNAVPSDPDGPIPKSTTVGTTTIRTWTTLPQGLTYTVGSKLKFQGNTKMILGDGLPNSKTIISFAASTDPAAEDTAFVSDFTSSYGQGTYYDYSCNLNWQKVDSDGTVSVPDSPPCVGDNVYVPDGKSWYISNYKTKAGARSIKYGSSYTSSAVILASCDDEQPPNVPVTFDLNVRPCKKFFNFGVDDYVNHDVCINSCPGTTLIVPGENGTTTTIKVYNNETDPRKGTVVVDKGGKVSNATDITVTTSDDGNFVVTKKGDNSSKPITFKSDGTTITPPPTLAPTLVMPSASPTHAPGKIISLGSNSAAGGGMGIIIGAAVGGLVLIIIVVVVVVFMLRKHDSGKDERNVVSFENPMYDDVTSKENPAFGQDDDTGIYDDPEMSNGTSGYMDVPANNNNDTSGYMDVPANNGVVGGGYMDVAPNAEDDSDEESDSEQEDI